MALNFKARRICCLAHASWVWNKQNHANHAADCRIASPLLSHTLKNLENIAMDKTPVDSSPMPAHPASSPQTAWRYGASLAVMAAAAGLGSFAALQQGVSVAAPTAVATAAAAVAQPAPIAVRGLPDFADLVQMAGPAVVSIETAVKTPRHRARRGQQNQPFGSGDPMMEEFFRRFFGNTFPQPPDEPGAESPPSAAEADGRLQASGSGSGFILSADGVVMTNAHVVDGADEVTVKLTDKRQFKAKVLGKDERSDIAVLKIDAQNLPFVRTGDVGKLRVGEWVIAIGAPFGLENTVTAGIVSAKQRDTGQFVRFIQTDVAVNPGNSGGPLINMRGEVVGVNSQILSGSGGYMGVSLSIPIDEAMKVASQLRATGSVQRGFLGVNIGDVDDAAAEALKLGKGEGAAITRVLPKSPADKAGLQAGDIVLKFNGDKIEGSRDLQRRTSATKPGDHSNLTILRSGKTLNIAVTTGSEKDLERLSKAEEHSKTAEVPSLGLKLSTLDAAQLRSLGLNTGLKVDAATGLAARAGLQAGDILLELANTPVQSVAQIQALAATLPPKSMVSVLYRRGDWTMRSGMRVGG
jgi:serine protease Do